MCKTLGKATVESPDVINELVELLWAEIEERWDCNYSHDGIARRYVMQFAARLCEMFEDYR